MQDIETQWRELRKNGKTNKADFLRKRKEIEKLYELAKKENNDKIKKEMLLKLLAYNKTFMKTESQFNLSYLIKYLQDFELFEKNTANLKKHVVKWASCSVLNTSEYNIALSLIKENSTLTVIFIEYFLEIEQNHVKNNQPKATEGKKTNSSITQFFKVKENSANTKKTSIIDELIKKLLIAYLACLKQEPGRYENILKYINNLSHYQVLIANKDTIILIMEEIF